MNTELEKMSIAFSEVSDTEEVFHDRDLVELKPIGLSLAHDLQRPFLLFRDIQEKRTLPVAISPLEAGIFLAHSQGKALHKGATPHRFLIQFMELFDIQIKRCVFVQIQPEAQYVRLYFVGHPMISSLKLRADEVMSVCLQFEIPIFATQSLIQKSLILKSQTLKHEDLVKNMIQVHTSQRYLM
ncbi:MAG: bifunctional nuclease domain-containing protein [Pseudobdellovibrionaceae bacterium]